MKTDEEVDGRCLVDLRPELYFGGKRVEKSEEPAVPEFPPNIIEKDIGVLGLLAPGIVIAALPGVAFGSWFGVSWLWFLMLGLIAVCGIWLMVRPPCKHEELVTKSWSVVENGYGNWRRWHHYDSEVCPRCGAEFNRRNKTVGVWGERRGL